MVRGTKGELHENKLIPKIIAFFSKTVDLYLSLLGGKNNL